jgi:hypothetical protein
MEILYLFLFETKVIIVVFVVAVVTAAIVHYRGRT